MAQEFSVTDQKRITFLSLLSSAATLDVSGEDPYELAGAWLEQMEKDGFFEESRPTQQRSEPSARRGSSSRQSSGGNRGRNGGGGFSGNMQNPDGPPSDKQVNFLLTLTDEYSRREIEDMTKADVSALIEDLK